MKKRFIHILLAALLALSLASCDLIEGLIREEEQQQPPAQVHKHTHAYSGSTCTESSVCACGDITAGPMGHDMSEPTSTEPAMCQRRGCDYRGDVALGHSPAYTEHEGVSSLACTRCGVAIIMSEAWYADGTDHDAIIGVENRDKYTTVGGTHNPLINEDGVYQLLNISGQNEQMQLWVPSNASVLDGFTSERGAVGFMSFRINAQLSTDFGLKFVDTNSTASRWSAEWCITAPFFSVSSLYLKDGRAMVSVFGWDKVTLKELEADIDTEFSGWIDVVIGIELDAESDSIILHYYVNGEYCATMAKPLTTRTNGINSVYFNGYITREGMGLYLDDIAFAYATDSEWIFD